MRQSLSYAGCYACDPYESVKSGAFRPMVHLYGVFIDCLMLVTFYRGSLSFCPVGWDCKILVIVGTLLEQH